MRPGSQFVMRAAARLHMPLIVLFAAYLLAARSGGGGVGFIAGLVFALAFILHVLVFGAAAARQAVPPQAARGALMLGLIGVLAAAGAPGLPNAVQIEEASLFVLTIGACALTITVLVGRAPTMREEDW